MRTVHLLFVVFEGKGPSFGFVDFLTLKLILVKFINVGSGISQ